MAEVFLAEDIKLGRKVAVKIPLYVPGHPLLIQRFLDEARNASSLQHPNVVQIHDCGECEDGRPFVVMEFVKGAPLSDLIDKGPLPPFRACEILDGLLRGLQAAHEQDLVHRDIKPGNIMIDDSGEVKVLDFGLSKHIAHASPNAAPDSVETISGHDYTPPGEAVGTPRYMSPDQIRGQALDERSDLFAAGVVFYECLTGRPAFEGATARELMVRILESTPPSPSTVRPGMGKEFDAFLAKALAKNPEDRFRNAKEMRRALSELRTTGVSQIWHRLWNQVRSSPLRAAASAAAATLIVLLVWIWITGSNYRPPPEAERFYQEGVTAIRDGTPYRAALALERALSADPSFVAARLRLAEARADLDYVERAQSELLRALGGDQSQLNELDKLFSEALRMRLSRDFPGAAILHRKIVEAATQKEKPRALVDLARAQERNEQPVEALQQYREAARLDPSYAAAHLGIATLLVRQQKLPEAEQELEKADALYQALSSAEGVAEVLYRRASLAVTARNAAKARENAEKALQQARSIGSLYQEISAMLLLSDLSHRAGNTAAAEKEALEAIELARHNSMATLVARGLVSLGNAWLVRGDYSKAREILQQARDHARTHDQPEAAAKATLALASVANQLSKPQEVLQLAAEAEKFYQRGGYRLQLSNVLLLRSRALRDLGDYEAALQTASQQRKLASDLGNDSLAALAEETRASSFYAMERFYEGLNASLHALELNRKLAHRVGIGYTLLRVSYGHSQLGRFQEAHAAINEAESIAGSREAGMAALLNRILIARAELALRQDKPSESIVFTREAIEIQRSNPQRSVELQLLLAHGLVFSGEFRKAIAALDEAAPLIAQSQDTFLAPRALLLRALAYRKSAQLPAARSAATSALASFDRQGQLDSAWRSALIASAIHRELNLPDAENSSVRVASDLLTRLTSTWPPEMKKSFLDRPDRVRYR